MAATSSLSLTKKGKKKGGTASASNGSNASSPAAVPPAPVVPSLSSSSVVPPIVATAGVAGRSEPIILEDGTPFAQFGIYFHQGVQNAFRIVQRNCGAHPERIALIWNNDDGVETERVTYGALLERVRAVARLLVAKGAMRDDRILLVYPPGLDFFYAFWACLAIGAIPVPVCPADPSHPTNDAGNKLQSIYTDSGARSLLTTREYIKAIQASSIITTIPSSSILNLDVYGTRWYTTDGIALIKEDDFKFPETSIDGNELAFIQYTSGSTGEPKGVMVSHSNLITNSALIIQMFAEIGEGRQNLYTFLEIVIVSWLPTFHDMGLIGFHVGPLLIGSTVSSMSPLTFIHNPMLWLRMLGRYKRVITGAPPFALELCAKKATPEDLRVLDLTRVEALLIGAEPIRDQALQQFASVFAPCGFNDKTLMPCYGLAEHVLFAAGKRDMSCVPQRICVDATQLARDRALVQVATNDDNGPASPINKEVTTRWLVSSGNPMRCDVVTDGGRLLIVNPDTHVEVADGECGEIWLAGKCKALGYWNKPEATRNTFKVELKGTVKEDSARWAAMYRDTGGWLRTGDMACWYNNQLYVTGRIKEMVIINGANLYPHDIEESAKSAHDAIRPGSITAFAVDTEDGNGDYKERLTMLVELRDPHEVAAAIAAANGGTTVRAARAPTSANTWSSRLALNILSLIGSVPSVRRCTSRLVQRIMSRNSIANRHAAATKESGYTIKQLDDISVAIRRSVLTTFGIAVSDLVLLRARSIKKTSSGKNCRTANRQTLAAGAFDDVILKRSRTITRSKVAAPVPVVAPAIKATVPVASSSLSSGVSVLGVEGVTSSSSVSSSLSSVTSESKRTATVLNLDQVKKQVIALAMRELDVGDDVIIDELRPLDEYGLDSISAAKLTKVLSNEFKVPLTVFMFLADPTIDGVARKIVQVVASHIASNGGVSSSSPRGIAGSDAASPINQQCTNSVPEWQPISSHEVAMVLGIGTAVPKRSGNQDEAHRVLVEKLNMDEKQSKMLRKIVNGTKIDRRHMVFDKSDDIFFGRSGKGNDEGVEARNTIFKKEAVKLSLASGQKALTDWGGDKSSITHVIGVSCTGVIIPGLEFHVMTGLGLSTSCERLSINFMGCFGALSAMKAAKSIARENPRNRVLLVCTELCSLHMQLDDRIENLVASALFADGSAAMVVGAAPRKGERPLFELHHSASHIIPNTLPMMSWELSKSGMIIGLDKHIPGEIFHHISAFANRLIPRDITANDCVWAIHPGGPMILTAIVDALKLNEKNVQSAWDVLRANGNMSSPTLIFVLNELRNTSRGKWMPSLAFGPGLNCEGAVLRACGKVARIQ